MIQVSYVIFEVPSNLVLARVRPSLYLSGLCILWGGVAACMAATHNWKQLAGVRFCLGIVEAGFAPGVTFHLSSWYKRYEPLSPVLDLLHRDGDIWRVFRLAGRPDREHWTHVCKEGF